MAVKVIPTLNPETFEIEYQEIEAPNCPKCGTVMAHRTNQIGGMFWGCPRYPVCRSAMDMTDQQGKRIDLNSINQSLVEKLTRSYPSDRMYGLILSNQDLSDKIKTWMKITGASNYGDLVCDLIEVNESLGRQINNLIDENKYLKAMVDSPRIEEEDLKIEIKNLEDEIFYQLRIRNEMREKIDELEIRLGRQIDDIDSRCDKDIDTILMLHRERQERRKKNEQKMKQAFARNKAPKPEKSYWLKRVAPNSAKKPKPSEFVSMADLGIFLVKATSVTSLIAVTVLCCEYVSRFI